MGSSQELIPNIGPGGCRKRLITGIVMLVFSLVLLFLFIQWGIARPWRALLFIPNFIAMLGFFQARNKTCVILSAMNVRNLDTGNQKISDSSLTQKINRQAERIYFHSSIAAALITVIWLVIF